MSRMRLTFLRMALWIIGGSLWASAGCSTGSSPSLASVNGMPTDAAMLPDRGPLAGQDGNNSPALLGDASAPATALTDSRGEPIAPAVDGGSAPDVADAGPAEGLACSPAESSERLPARLGITDGGTAATVRSVFVGDIYNLFTSTCGGCHVEGSLGGFHVSADDFAAKVDQRVRDRILATDPARTMPPASAGGKLASERAAGDPVLELASLIGTWINAGKPAHAFSLAPDSSGAHASHGLSPELGSSLTNLGNCIPSKAIVAVDTTEMDTLDARFAAMTRSAPGAGSSADRLGLPERLEQTDLVTLDSEALARRGVIAYAPTYPLWSDGAGKLRHVRVPRGQSIHFDASTQRFDIPPNTRFYKTFFKAIVDADGIVRHRKIETRVIVARPNRTRPDGTGETGATAGQALFGTYSWNDDETEAVLVTDPLRNGEPFRDRLLTYIVDEPRAQAIRAQNSEDLGAALQRGGVLHRYAIPGSQRCVDCHMGSPSRDFVLGFLPLQVRRRPQGEGGVLEPAKRDELTQLERLVDYGVISGIRTPSDVAPLEASQGERKPRNDHELLAQGYALGNCAHCHNPRGLPSVENPVLKDALDMAPSATGGLFQFPLDRMSARIARGIGGLVPIPYITPSLVEYPVRVGESNDWTPKCDQTPNTPIPYVILAPWRSLIYRNVDTPFTYSDDLALFPHMPMDSPGFDCRAPGIFADWMVSIPAHRTHPEIPEYNLPPVDGSNTVQRFDQSPQPYVEVPPSDPNYDLAVQQAEERLEAYHLNTPPFANGTPFPSRYRFCPDTSDIVDPKVLDDPDHHPAPIDDQNGIWRGDPPGLVMPWDGVPDHAHWVVSDFTQLPGNWNPRRPDWADVLVRGSFPPISDTDSDAARTLARQQAERQVVDMLANVHLTDRIRSYAGTKVPFGLWSEKEDCHWDGVPTVADFAANRPRWMDRERLPVNGNQHVYTVLPGEAVFQMICSNCHGPKADSAGRQAQNLNLMTGGNARVADLREGLFGPVSAPGQNRARVFGSAAAEEVSADEWGARYLAWMGLGGTQRLIPASILAIVGNTQVLGEPRHWNATPVDANMLSAAQNLCRQSLPIAPDPSVFSASFRFDPTGFGDTALIGANGDGELWRHLCAIDNPPPVRAVWSAWDSGEPSSSSVRSSTSMFPRAIRRMHP